MPSEILTLTAVALLKPVIKTAVPIIPIHIMRSAPSGDFATADGQEVLLESDIEESFKSYITPYVNAAFLVPGAWEFESLKSISNLSELTTKNGDPIALTKTTGIISCEVTSAAKIPLLFTDDPLSSYDLEFEFIYAGQTFAKSD